MAEETIDIPTVAMGVIINAGDGRVCIDKAMDSLAELDLDAAEEYLRQADEKILAAHRAQTEMIQREAAGEKVTEFGKTFTAQELTGEGIVIRRGKKKYQRVVLK